MSWAGAEGLRITGEKSKRNATDLLRYRSALKRGYNRVQIGDRYRHTCVGSPETEAGILNIGDIQLEPGHRVKGTIVLPYGASVPNGMRVIISANRACDSHSPAVRGYRPVQEGLKGVTIDHDIDDLKILLTPSHPTY